ATNRALYFGASSLISFWAFCSFSRYSLVVIGCMREPSGLRLENASGRASESLQRIGLERGDIVSADAVAALFKNCCRDGELSLFKLGVRMLARRLFGSD